MTKGFGRIAAEEAYRATLSTRAAKWPGRGEARAEPICRPAFTPGFTIGRDASVFTIGSCFARHIEQALAGHGLTIPTLDFRVPKAELWAGTGMITGILNKYTPLSMLNEVAALDWAEGEERRFLIQAGEDAWWDGQLHTTEMVTLERALKRRAKIRDLYARAIDGSAVVIVTLGLVEAWFDREAGLYLNDTAPRALVERYPGRFQFETLAPDAVIAAVDRLVARLHARNPAAHLLMTVSPVPFARSFSGGDAMTANAYSKAVLRVAAECAVRAWPHVDYFPSYESVTMSDRALAWEDDLVHVRDELVAANVARMVAAYVEGEAEGAR
ncbi:GSCFA domain-containing protein [Sphingomonas quercus]|uniref:GSCFA domain-containing protein n=1 Tax=Sphingomonas quercus TaxID=2842451 RepID=A0ABS6BFB7_9SPHN|nr:GSCFA domain-containing protein [Sphingomonas quercus]MBU3076995.1 GSCFA domain-containing protein [Sphingomonas quercus]